MQALWGGTGQKRFIWALGSNHFQDLKNAPNQAFILFSMSCMRAATRGWKNACPEKLLSDIVFVLHIVTPTPSSSCSRRLSPNKKIELDLTIMHTSFGFRVHQSLWFIDSWCFKIRRFASSNLQFKSFCYRMSKQKTTTMKTDQSLTRLKLQWW